MIHKKPKYTVRGDMAKLGHLFNEFNETAMRILTALDIEGKAIGYCSNPKVLRIQQIVADHYQMPISIMTSKLKPANFVEPRHVAIALCVDLTSFRTVVLGQCFNRDHSAILYASESVRDRIKQETSFANQYASIKLVAENSLNALPANPTTPVLQLQFAK